MTMGTHSMLAMLEVKGETTEASAWESEMPTSAAFRAPQSLAPSPHMPTQYLTQRGVQEWPEPVRRLRVCEVTPLPSHGLAGRRWGWPGPCCLHGTRHTAGAQQVGAVTASGIMDPGELAWVFPEGEDHS